MRLRLRIERNALPATQAIWPIKESKSTVSQLLQQVNEVFPLEGETWGLEDYSVTVGGYECLHYHELGTVCKDEDEVVIQPLAHVDVRARTLAGRSQIAADGRHLVDGVPFGRPCLKKPMRPDVRIPPRKRRKLLEDGEAEPEILMITQAGEAMDEDEDEDDELDDEDFDENASDVATSGSSSSESESDDSESSSDSSGDSDSTSDDSESESESDSDGESWSGIPGSNQATPQSKTASNLPNGTATDDAPSPSAGIKRKRGLDAEDLDVKLDGEINRDESLGSLPGQGKSSTRQRNQRRRDAKKLKHLKKLAVLPPDADFSTMREMNDNTLKRKAESGQVTSSDDSSSDSSSDEEVISSSIGNRGVKRLRSESEANSVTKTPGAESAAQASHDEAASASQPDKSSKRRNRGTKYLKDPESQFEVQRQKLLADIASGGVDLDARNESPPQEISSKAITQINGAEDQSADLEGDKVIAEMLLDESIPARRAHLDIAGSKRLLFGSLGVRVPKTQEEKDRIQKKLAERPKCNANAVDHDGCGQSAGALDGVSKRGEASTEVGDEEEDPKAWREKINLTAVECCDEDVELSTPPFPFYQRWDPQYNRKKKKRNSSKYSDNSKFHNQAQTEYVETYDKYNINADGDALDYDEEEAGDEYWEDGALLGDDEDAEAGALADPDDGFPAIPATLGELGLLLATDAQKNDFIAFTELACDERTDWQPRMVTRTAKVLDVPDSADQEAGQGSGLWTLQLAQRDQKPKVFDEDGNRVYSKFDMPDTDAEDEGVREVSWEQLGDVRLILRPEVAAE